MHELESFSVVATIFGVPRKLNFDSLGGLTVAGLRADEARTIAEILERGTADKPLLVAESARPAPPARRPNRAKWGPKAADGPEVVVNAPEPARAAPEPDPAPDDTPDTPADCGAPETAPEDADTAQDAAPACAPDTAVGEDDVPDAVPPADVMPEEPAPTAKRKRNTRPEPKPDTRPDHLKAPRKKDAPPLKLPDLGDKYDGREVVDFRDHPDKGRMIILSDGWRVKLDATGKEVARMEGVPPEDVAGVKTAAEIQGESSNFALEHSENAEEAPSSSYPAKIMETRSSREVVEYLLDNGTDKDDLVGVCLTMKESGAAAFAPTKDEDGVRRRVNAALAVLGRA